MLVLHSPPKATAIRLDRPPQLASWNRGDAPDKVQLAAYVDYVTGVAVPSLAEREDPLAVELVVGLPITHHLTAERDLDNYLYPVVNGLGANRFVAVFGRKLHQDHSPLAIGPAMTLEPDALGPLLGADPRPKRPHGEARDGRITELALHQTATRVSEGLGHRERWALRISFWWQT